MLQCWQVLHRIHAILRWPIKLVLAVAACALILFPKIWLLPVEIERIGNYELLIEPNNPLLAPLAAEVRDELATTQIDTPAEEDGEAVQRPITPLEAVQDVVYRHVPYGFDWDIWGVMQYTPTIDEVFAAGQEDCDGRAIVAASLLRRLGIQAWIVTDLQHCWVRTPDGDTMSPGKGEATLKQDAPGERTRVVWDWGLVQNFARGTAWGIGAFPLTRLICFYLVFVALTVHPWSGINRRLFGAGIMLIALGLLREGGVRMLADNVPNELVWSGLAAAVVGWLILAFKADVTPQRTPVSESPAARDAAPD